MRGAVQSGVLGHLRDQIARLEARPPIRSGGAAETLRSRAGAETGFRPWRDAPAGLVHEIWTRDGRDAGAGTGFALGLARRHVTGKRPAVLWLTGPVEAGEAGLVYGAGLAFFGLDPERLVIGRMKAVADLLWTAEEALGCAGVAAVVADIAGYPKALDFTASRRLALRAARSGASVFLSRTGPEKPASAAFMRWQVEPAPSGVAAFDARAAGPARFSVSLERSGSGLRGDWLLEWHNDGFGEIGRDAEPGVRPAASGAVVSVLGDGLSRTA